MRLTKYEVKQASKCKLHDIGELTDVLIEEDLSDIDTMNAHVQKMLQDAIQSEGVEEVFSTDKDINAEAVDLFSDEYLERIKRIKLQNTRIKIYAQLLKKGRWVQEGK